MTLYEFRMLNDAEQANETWAGRFLSSRVEHGYKVLLYSVGSFYVEAYYSDLLNEIFKLKAFETTRLLEPYLVGFNL